MTTTRHFVSLPDNPDLMARAEEAVAFARMLAPSAKAVDDLKSLVAQCHEELRAAQAAIDRQAHEWELEVLKIRADLRKLESENEGLKSRAIHLAGLLQPFVDQMFTEAA